MKYTAEDRVTFAKIASAAVKRKQPIPEYVVPRPDILPDAYFWYVAYCELQANNFNFGECKLYAEHYNVDFETLRYTLRMMQHGYKNSDGD